MNTPESVSIRKTTYRDMSGFLVMQTGGRYRGTFGARIFTKCRCSAERIRDRVQAGQRTQIIDFTCDKECAAADASWDLSRTRTLEAL